MDDLLRSPRALAFLAVLAGGEPLPVALTRLHENQPPRICDRSLLTDPVALLSLYFRTVGDWRWSPLTESILPALLDAAPILESVAGELRRAPAVAKWWDPLDRDHQAWIHKPGVVPTEASFRPAFVKLHPWASKPEVFWTSTSVPPLPSTWLFAARERLLAPPFSVWRLPVSNGASVWEIHQPEHWIELCRRYPADTTVVYREQWRKWGVRESRIVTPDWARVASDWQGVHLSLGGLLTTEGVTLSIDGRGSLLEGWGSEGTAWLRWPFGAPERLSDWNEPLPG